MKRTVLAIALLVSSFATAHAEATCQYGKGGVFEFKSWSFKKTEGRWMEVAITFRNLTDMNLTRYEMHIEVGEHMFGIRGEVPVAAGGVATAANELGMPQEDADMFKPLTPLLCAIGVTDDRGEHTSYY